MPTFARRGIEVGSCGVFGNGGLLFATYPSEGFVCIAYHEFLSEGIDIAGGAPYDDKFIGIALGKSDGIPYDISIQSSKGADNKGIGFAYFHLYEGDCFGGGGVQFCQRDKLVVNTIVEHQQHGRVVGVILDPKETFGGIVGLPVLHTWRGNEAFVLLSVGGKADPSVEEYLQFAPYFA